MAMAFAPDGDVPDTQAKCTEGRQRPACARSKGGFFQAHEDYLSVTSNVVQEYTLLVGVPPSSAPASSPEQHNEPASPGRTCVGGETVVYLGPVAAPQGPEAEGPGARQAVVSSATSRPGGALLFRKDLRHEGRLVAEGEKHVVSLNVWALRKASPQVRACVRGAKR